MACERYNLAFKNSKEIEWAETLFRKTNKKKHYTITLIEYMHGIWFIKCGMVIERKRSDLELGLV